MITVSFVLWFLASFLYHGLGVTLGYHRLLTHKSLKVPTWLKYIIVSGGYLCFMGAPINWVGVHRLHHQKSDQDGDPHSPVHGFKHALYGWMFTMGERQSNEELQKQVPDLLQDKLFCLLGTDHSPSQAGLCFTVCIVARLILLAVLGWVPFVANAIASFIVFWSPQLVNSICHMQNHGYRLWKTRDESRNVWWVAVISCGEGWHNTHHAVPRCARHGMLWWEFDITYITICILEKLGLATDVVRPQKMPTVQDIHRHGAVIPETLEEQHPPKPANTVPNNLWNAAEAASLLKAEHAQGGSCCGGHGNGNGNGNGAAGLSHASHASHGKSAVEIESTITAK